MRHHDKHLLATILILATLVATIAGPAAAQTHAAQTEHRFSIEAFWPGDTVITGDDIDTSFGVRSTYRFGRRWAVDGGVSYFDYSNSETLQIDLAARYLFKETKKFHFFALAGPVFERRLFRTFTFNPETFEVERDGERQRSEDIELGLGLGFEFDVTKRFFLRPELVANTKDSSFNPFDLRLGFGFRI